MSEIAKRSQSALPECMAPDGAEPCKGYSHLYLSALNVEQNLNNRIAELESKLDESYDWWEAQEMLIDDYEATIAELREAASWSRDLLWRMQSGQVLDKYKVSPPQCTCVTDKEMTCIVHPTTRSLKEYIARLVAIADAAEIVLINTDKLFSEHRELKSLLEGE